MERERRSKMLIFWEAAVIRPSPCAIQFSEKYNTTKFPSGNLNRRSFPTSAGQESGAVQSLLLVRSRWQEKLLLGRIASYGHALKFHLDVVALLL